MCAHNPLTELTRLRGESNDALEAEQIIKRLRQVSDGARTAGITTWEYDLKADGFTWTSQRHPGLGLDDVPLAEFVTALSKIVLDEDRHILIDAPSRAVANNQENFSYKYRVRGEDGKIHHVNNVCKFLRNSRGNFRYLVGVTIDVTQEAEANVSAAI
jgi:PAS domain-containing protein